MAPLYEASSAAYAAFENARRESRSLRREAIATLNASLSPEALREHERLGHARVTLEQRLRTLQADAPRLAQELGEVEAEMARLQPLAEQQAKFPALTGETPPAAIGIKRARHRREELLRSNSELLRVEVEYAEAVEAAERWERETFTDWRRMKFD